MGVITETDVDYGRIYGPFPAVGHIPQSHFIGLLAADERNEARSIKINLGDSSVSNTWLPYVQPARNVEEQNVEAYSKDGHIFYRTLRIIRADEELLVWYSKDFAQILGIPSIKRCPENDDNTYMSCDNCAEKFRHLFPLTAHARFRCTRTFRRQIIDGEINAEPNKSDAEKDIDILESKIQHLSNVEQALKRSIEVDDNVSAPKKRLSLETFEENNNVKVPFNISPGAEREPENRDVCSAFRKVEKSHLRDANLSDSVTSFNKNSYNANERKTAINANAREELISQQMYNKSILQSRNAFESRLTGGVGMLVPNWMVAAGPPGHQHVNRRMYGERVPVSSAEKMDIVNRMNGISNDAIRSFQNGDALSKQILMEQLRKTQYPFIQSTNPMVEKILTTTSTPALLQRPVQPLNLAQNWCAKCNATFRMTSDLVYHMRSHHKREFDPMKRKREDKLQCHVCKETFKERHHLTRHMTSHT